MTTIFMPHELKDKSETSSHDFKVPNAREEVRERDRKS